MTNPSFGDWVILLYQFPMQGTPTEIPEMLLEHPNDTLGLFGGELLTRVISSVVIAGELDTEDLAYFAYRIPL